MHRICYVCDNHDCSATVPYRRTLEDFISQSNRLFT